MGGITVSFDCPDPDIAHYLSLFYALFINGYSGPGNESYKVSACVSGMEKLADALGYLRDLVSERVENGYFMDYEYSPSAALFEWEEPDRKIIDDFIHLG